jgi:hypothetical protein
MKDEALKLALEALELFDHEDNDRDFLFPYQCTMLDNAITAIKQALAAPVQEPVGWFKYDKVSGCWHPQHDEFAPTHAVREGWKQLYTTPHVAPVQDGSAFFKQFQTGLMDVTPASPVQEPVAWSVTWDGVHCGNFFFRECDAIEQYKRLSLKFPNEKREVVALYTTPPAAQRQWVGLTDEEIRKTADACDAGQEGFEYTIAFARAIEAKLKEKNT